MKFTKAYNRGFTLVQISALLMVVSLVMVAVLPTSQKELDANKLTSARMAELMKYFRSYMVATGKLPCPADAALATGAANYGVAAANGGTVNDCSGSSPAANYVDATNDVAIGMVPYKTLGIPKELVLDAWGRVITYAVDTKTTASCWVTPAAGAITVTDKGVTNTSVIALVSHGSNGHGAYIPLPGGSGTGVRLNNNSSDVNELLNAHVDSIFVASSTLTNFVATTPSATFDDLIVYQSPLWTMNGRPAAATASFGSMIASVSTPTSGYYFYRQVPTNYVSGTISFTVTLDSAVTITGTPRLALTAVSVGGGTVSLTGNSGSGDTGYANYASGSGTTSLTFTYPVQSTDMAPNGLTAASTIDLNGGTVTSLCSNSLTSSTLTGVIIPKVEAITASGTWVVPVDWNSSTNHIHAIGSGGNGAQGTATTGGAGGGGGAHASTSTPYIGVAGNSVTVTVGTGGGTTRTIFADTGTLVADYGKNASGTTAGAGGLATSSYPNITGNFAEYGGNGGNNGGSTRGGGGAGGGAGGPLGVGRNGGDGANTGGGGGGGGGAHNCGGASFGSNGTAFGSVGGYGGRGCEGTAVSNRGAAGGGNATAGVTDKGTGGGGGGGSNSASVNSGSGGAGSSSVTSGASYVGWTTNVGSVATYGAGGGGGGSGGANGATSNSGAAGNGGSYGGGGGGSGGATGTAGAAGTGGNGLIVITYR